MLEVTPWMPQMHFVSSKVTSLNLPPFRIILGLQKISLADPFPFRTYYMLKLNP